MPNSDSFFLFEFAVLSKKNLIEFGNDFSVKCHLSNFFTIRLKDQTDKPKHAEKKTRKNRRLNPKKGVSNTFPTGRAIIVANEEKLLSHLKGHELELSLWSKTSPETKLGSSPLPWSHVLLNYLKQLSFEPPPAKITHEYYIYDDAMTKQVAIVKLNMNLALLRKHRLDPHIKSIYKFYKPDIEYIEIKNIPVEKSNTESNTKVDEDTNNSFGIQELLSNENTNDLLTTNWPYDIETKTIRNSNSSSLLLAEDPLNNPIVSFKSKSYTSLTKKSLMNTLKHVFGDYRGPYGNKVYCVGYVTVENDQLQTNSKSETKPSSESPTLSTAPETTMADEIKSSDSKCSDNFSLQECKNVSCVNRCFRQLPDRSDKPILLDITTMKRELCCVTGKMEIDQDPCLCTCKCTFGFTKKTTYCGICGGYEKAGEEFRDIHAGDIPYPCPIYHKLIDKNKLKQTNSFNSSHYDSKGSSKGKGSKGSSRTSQKESKGSDKSEKKKHSPEPDKIKKRKDSRKSFTRLSITATLGGKKADVAPSSKKAEVIPGGKRAEVATSNKKDEAAGKSDNESKECKKNKKQRDTRFRFNYGYKAPKIGHIHCFDPCTGSLKPVPNHMGWLWTAGDVPGLKYRPHWRPGATHKNVVKLLRQAKNPNEIIGKKKKKDMQLTKKKRPLKRPLLVVDKKNGEFSVTIEQMKEYGANKIRNINQPPFDDKTPMTFTVGRTEEENIQRQKKKLRQQRRLERAQRMFIQSAFQDLCHEICLKTYQQALGILPDAEKPECTCYPALPDPKRVDTNVSCSCSENSTDISDTDSDEWVMEFNPPNCYYKPSPSPAVKKNPKTDSDSQYTYLDYRVKILDKSGNEIPRFFIGPNGKQECSDLGGFKGPDGKWLQIGVDGYIGPDGRWAPYVFTGPNGEKFDSEDGKFTTLEGETFTVGVDGYIVNGVWKFYGKSKVAFKKGKSTDNKDKRLKEQNNKDRMGTDNKNKNGRGKDKSKDNKDPQKNEEKDKKGKLQNNAQLPTVESGSQCDFSCFGTTSPKKLSEMGIRGHGQDRKLLLARLQKMLSKGIKVKVPEDPSSRSRDRADAQKTDYSTALHDFYTERAKCKHPAPSPKGVLCCDEFGRKTYFKIQDPRNPRPGQRLANLYSQGKSVSSFHIPCFDSLLNYGTLCQQQQNRSAMPYCRPYPTAAGDQYTYVT